MLVAEALNFESVWGGIDLIAHLTRNVSRMEIKMRDYLASVETGMPLCPACGEGSRKITAVRDAEIFACANCGMVHATEISVSNPADLASSSGVVNTDPQYFAKTLQNYERQTAVARRIVSQRLAHYEKFIGRKVRKVLEIGPGSGAWAKAYVENGVEYVGIEIVESIGQQAREITGTDIRIGNFLSNDTYLGSDFDVVFASQVFEHILTPSLFLKRAKEVCNNGILHLDVPNHNSLVSTARKLPLGKNQKDYGFIQPPYHMLAYTKPSLERLLQRDGLSDIKVQAYENNHAVWGQLIYGQSALTNVVFMLGKFSGLGSLLTAIARTP